MPNNRIRNIGNTYSRFGQTSQELSPASTSRNQIIAPEYSHRLALQQKNDNMLQNMKLKFLLHTLIKKIRYLTPPVTVPEHIHEEWQFSGDNDQAKAANINQYTKQTLKQQLSHQYDIFRHLNVIEGILIVLFCWLVTVSIVFQIKIGFQFFLVTLIISFGRIIFLSTVAFKERNNQKAAFLLDINDDLIGPLILAISCGLFMIRYQYQLGIIKYFIQTFGLIAVIVQYKHIQINFRNIVKYAQQNRMKKELRIIELFLLIMALAHFFGLILYGMSLFSPHENWLKKADLSEQEWHIKYIYCFYWAVTTTVTVGYGDLTPTNHYEVIIITIIELVGTAVFGYMINVIGITVDEIKKKTQQFDNYQQTIDKLQDHYKLSRQLCYRMKHDIKQKQNEFKNIPLKTTQEKKFLDYIQPTLKQQFVLQTNMKVIKKSIFFLTHFSVNFQNQIALKLIRIIYKPLESIDIFDQQNQRSLVIINSGAADIYIQNHHNNIEIMKKVRQIKPSQDSLVMNVFGYSALIMNRNIKLKAIAKQTAVSYVLRRKDFLQCIDKNMLDFESFNEMRQKMLLLQILEQVEAPSLKESQKHFLPNIFLIQKKITYKNQARLTYYRSSTRTKLKLITSKNYKYKTIPKIEEELKITDGQNYSMDDQDFKSLKLFEINKFDDMAYLNQDELLLGKLRIDQCKIFENFMKNSNLPVVASAYEKSCQKKGYLKRFRNSLITKPGKYRSPMFEKDSNINSLKNEFKI